MISTALFVDGVEFDRFVEAREDADSLTQVGKLAVRYRNARAHARGPKPFALNECVEDFEAVQPREVRRTLSEHLQCLLFIGRFEGRNDGIWRHEVAKIHVLSHA